MGELQLGFYGTVTDQCWEDGSGVSRELYLVALARGAVPHILPFDYSDKLLIQMEGDLIMYGCNELLQKNTPLLLLRLNSGIHVPEKAFKVMELLRYADHHTLRGRGVATAVVETLRDRLREEGTEYLHLLPTRCVWPRSAHPIAREELPEDVRHDIVSCFVRPEPCVLWDGTLTYLTDRTRHEKIYAATSRLAQPLPRPSPP